MSLFPIAVFAVRFDAPVLVPGTRATGMLDVTLPEAIPRARAIYARFSCEAWGVYSNGKSSTTYTHRFLDAPLQLPLGEGGLTAGHHPIPFAIDLPRRLPPAVNVDGSCGVRYMVHAELDVDWAWDPSLDAVLPVNVLAPPVFLRREPYLMRLPLARSKGGVLEMSLASRVVRVGEPVVGQVALRGDDLDEIDGIELCMGPHLTLRFAHGDQRFGVAASVRPRISLLRRGATVPFSLPTTGLSWDEQNGIMDVVHVLRVMLDMVTFSLDRFIGNVQLFVLPPNATLIGDAELAPIGLARLEGAADLIAAETGSPRARLPELGRFVESNVTVVLEDGGPGRVSARWLFPPLALGLAVRQRTILGEIAHGGHDETPAVLAATHIVSAKPESPFVVPGVVRAFLDVACAGLTETESLQLSDMQLANVEALHGDERAETYRELVMRVRERASAIGRAIAALPFSTPGVDAARWRELAAAERATLLPHGPSVLGLRREVRTRFGESRFFSADLLTRFEQGHASTQLVVRAENLVVPEEVTRDGVVDSVEAGSWLGPLRSVFPDMRVAAPNLLTLVAPSVCADPRTLVESLDAAIGWFLSLAGEQRADSAYR